MANALIRGLSQTSVAHIDQAASDLGLSRNEYLRRKLEAETQAREECSVTAADWQRSAEAFADLCDPTVMASAWPYPMADDKSACTRLQSGQSTEVVEWSQKISRGLGRLASIARPRSPTS